MPCEEEHRNPNLKLFSYLMTSLLTSKFLQKLLVVHVYTHAPLLDPRPWCLSCFGIRPWLFLQRHIEILCFCWITLYMPFCFFYTFLRFHVSSYINSNFRWSYLIIALHRKMTRRK
jgi:hypothetical protein